ncbi:MurR/RpiR family transcriptional regulator [Kitasatospora phosalacinea]|uniref:MurR/RpiR family transcriptional regulator n=1 Tax=Kitasatospora phosalacinea TaxID=2065 RepID=UPI000527B399|nr:MurR/RpiR family transcriptional regulator [Kitasatospora phosalacinea]
MPTVTLAEDIRQRLGDCSPAERKVGRILLAGWPAAGFETIATLAERAGVSAPTVIRFVNRLGYRGFPDFQAALRAELDERHASPVTLYSSGNYGSAAADPAAVGAKAENLLAHGREVFTAAVDRTLAEVTPHDLDRAVQLLADPKRRITLVGGRFTNLFAQYLGLHLMQVRDDVRFLPDRPVERTALLSSLARRDVLVVFDYRRYEEDKVTVAELVREAGGRVVLFTDTWLSPVSTHAEVVFSSQVGAPSPYDSLVPSLAVVESLVAGLIAELGDRAHQHMRHNEETATRAGLT